MGTTLALTLTNPMTILAFVAIFAGAGLATTGGDSIAALLLVPASSAARRPGGCCFPSACRCCAASSRAPVLRWINWIAGGVIVAFGVIGDFARVWVGVEIRDSRD
jgi:threonine/homoserine/homoserine lactone efflux protein